MEVASASGTLTVLLVDDSETDRMLLRAALAREAPGAFSVDEVSSLDEGLAYLAEREPSVVVLDLGLPDSNGLEGLQKIVGAWPQLPVVLLTGLADTDLAVDALRNGAQDYVVKGTVGRGSTAQVLRYAVERRELEKRVKEAELQNEQDRREFERKLADAQRLEALGVLAGGIAHDFNNLLGVILGNTSLALELLGSDAAVRDLLEQSQLAAVRSAELTKQMLAYSGKGQFVIKVVDFPSVVRDMTELLRATISKRVEIALSFDDATPHIEVDVSQLNQVLLNLLTNASEAIGDRRGTINLSTRAVHVDAATVEELEATADLREGLYAELRVEDEGTGMDDATLERIFDPFFTTKFTGRGLGLAAIHGIVRAHGGAIRVRSQLGVGTTFELLFPAAERSAAPGPAPDVPDAPQPLSGKVLVADDEPSQRKLARAMLEWLGFEVCCVGSGEEALQAYRDRPDEFALVMLDQMMPGMTGHDVINALLEMGSTTPIILSSGYNAQFLSQNLVRKGVAAFLQKPYEVAQLQATIEGLTAGAGRPPHARDAS